MQISARNKLAGTVASIKLEHEIVSVVTRTSVEELGLAEGDSVTAIIKSTEVMLAR
jgi:molybdopterin-binding protein